MYTLEIDNTAYKVFNKLPAAVREAVYNEAQVLRDNPLVGEALAGRHRGLRSLHFGFKGTQYRIIYQIVSQTSTIIIRLAGTRENIYRKLEEVGR